MPKQLRHFRFTFEKLVSDYKIDRVVIRQRMTKGKFAGGWVGFKLEGILQTAESLDVRLISATAVKESLKRTPLNIEFKETGLKQFQSGAFDTAFAYLNLKEDE